MTATTENPAPRAAFRRGVLDALPFVVMVAPFAFLFGVVARDAGLDLAAVLGFSITVFAGASQFTALQLMADNAPTLVVLATALAVNLRTAMYSASLTPHLGAAPFWQRVFIAYFLVDQTYALSLTRFEQRPDWTLAQRTAYYFGVTTPIYPVWLALTVAGALVGTAIPGWLALDFAVPICFLAIVGPMLRSPAHVAAALTSIVGTLALAVVPYGLGLLIAAAVAMAVGARVELWQEARRGRPRGVSVP